MRNFDAIGPFGPAWARKLTIHRQVCLPAKLMKAAGMEDRAVVAFRAEGERIFVRTRRVDDADVLVRKVTSTRQVVLPRSVMETVGITEEGWVYVAGSEADRGCLVIAPADRVGRIADRGTRLISVGAK